MQSFARDLELINSGFAARPTRALSFYCSSKEKWEIAHCLLQVISARLLNIRKNLFRLSLYYHILLRRADKTFAYKFTKMR